MYVFIDIEVNRKNIIADVGCVNDQNDRIHTTNHNVIKPFLDNSDYYIGHNIVMHDLKFLRKLNYGYLFAREKSIDTLFLSTLFFPKRPYHKLVKDDKKLQTALNNPLNDALIARELFYEIIEAFNKLDKYMKAIYYVLLKDVEGFQGFFSYLKYSKSINKYEDLIAYRFSDKICSNVDLKSIIENNPLELAYTLSLINTSDENSLLPRWVLVSYPEVEKIMMQLRGTPCHEGCVYCKENLNAVRGLQKYFGYDAFKVFEGKPLQELAVNAALRGESLITIFPTGGGKSLAFQLPALINRETTRGLTIVISPLQSLMKDQVDNLENKSITTAVTINGQLDPIQRANAFKRVADGSATILYLAPESLRSPSIERLLMSRQIIRFVIDEAHCFSTWGQDFRIDYQYIAEFIKKIQASRGNKLIIPVSCFTATAKPDVIEDIKTYFKTNLDLDMSVFQTNSSRTNLHYKVYESSSDKTKYALMRDLIDPDKPTIIYASRRKTVEDLQKKLVNDGIKASFFHGGMEKEDKIANQDAFKANETKVMVATSAFGMGVDKDDIKCVIHYDISDSLENYMQESGRAGRSENIEAECYILYDEEDLNSHFELLNSSKINIKEIQSVWKAIRNLTKFNDSISQSALELAKQAGWDESIYGLETKMITAIAALEDAGYIKRGTNSPRVFANSILVKEQNEAIKIIEKSELFGEDIDSAKKIITALLLNKYKSRDGVEGENRVDYLSDTLGIERKLVIKIITLLRQAKILADDKDLTANIKANSKPNAALKTLKTYISVIRFLLDELSEEFKIYNIKSLNEKAMATGISTTTKILRTAINYLEIRKSIILNVEGRDTLKMKIDQTKEALIKEIELLYVLADEIVNYLFEKSNLEIANENDNVTFSVLELKKVHDDNTGMVDSKVSVEEIENTLFFLQKISAFGIEGGFMVFYSPINIKRIVKDTHRQYTKTDYKKLNEHYKVKMQQIHIVGEYAKKMIANYQGALTFVNDYFSIPYDRFIRKYFKDERRAEIDNNMSPKKFKQLFGELTTEQLNIIRDRDNYRIAVSAGPGSGKTKLLVHKLASIVYTEDIRDEQLLMLTFSRAAAMEFKERLIKLIGKKAHRIDIRTFHSYAFDLLGKVGDLEKTENIIKDATMLINNGEADPFKISKAVLVIDEAQDMTEEEFNLIQALIGANESIRVIAVGDDDQNIFEFRGSNSAYFRNIAKEENAFYQLSTNFRSKQNIVDFSNKFAQKIKHRLKSTPINAYQKKNGQIRLVKYNHENFIVPLVEDVMKAKLEGTTCILTWRNDKALQINGLLNKHNIPSKLIQSNDDFAILHLYEISKFYDYLLTFDSPHINKDQWKTAIEYFTTTFKESSNYEISLKMLKKFIITSGDRIHLSDLREFLLESKMSDFYIEARIMVSTFHKAKGKEFDNVFVLIDSQDKDLIDQLRVLYVGITRAKTNLTIHTNSSVFDSITVEGQDTIISNTKPSIPDRLSLEVGFKGVNLGYQMVAMKGKIDFLPGAELVLDEEHILKVKNRKIMKFSSALQKQIEEYLSTGYVLSFASIKNLVYWYNRDEEQQYLIALPELTFDFVDDSVEALKKTNINQE